MGARIRAFDWSATTLGPTDSWPRSLRAVVELMLASRQPTYIGWGSEVISLFMYRLGFFDLQAGRAAAVAVVMLVVNLLLAWVAGRLIVRDEPVSREAAAS